MGNIIVQYTFRSNLNLSSDLNENYTEKFHICEKLHNIITLQSNDSSLANETRMHSSRMRTARSSGRPRGSPPGTPHLRCQAPPPTRSPWTRPPGTWHPPPTTPGTIPRDQTPRDHTHPWDQAPPPPVDRILYTCF